MLAKNLDLNHPLHWSVQDILSEEECKALLLGVSTERFEPAPINTGGVHLQTNLRNNARLMFENADLSTKLGERLDGKVPKILQGARLLELNPRFRVYLYHPGEFFGAHYDESIHLDDQRRSLLTILVYLNDDFGGGETRFLDLKATVKPRVGSALLFQHHVLHEGLPVTSGMKWVLRTEAFYHREAWS